MSENNELKIKIPVLVDDSAAAKGRFQRSIRDLAKEMRGANAPKIEITVSKINGKAAIQVFKKEIEAAIGSVGKGGINSKKNNSNKYWQGRFNESVSGLTAKNTDIKPLNDYYRKLEAEYKRMTAELEKYTGKARKLNDINGAGSKIANFDTTIEMYRKLGLNVDAAATDLKELHSAKRNFDAAMAKGDKGEIVAAYKALDLAIQKTGNSFSKVSKQRSADTSINKEKASLHNLILEMQAYEKQNNKFRSNSKHALAFDDLNGKMQTALKAGDFSAIAEYTEKWKILKGSIRSASLEGQTFGTRLQQQFAKLGVYLSATAVIMQLRRAIKATINTVIELDGVVTDLQIATGGTRKETQELLNTYSKMGKELGATTVEVGKAADAWLRQGYSVEQANTLIKNSMILSKLGQIDSAEATKALTSAMKGYGISADETIGIVDKFTSVDAKAAITAGYLATAMAETATSARIAGVDMDSLVGYIASVGEVTQDGAESVGNFMKVLFARMGNIKAGELVDPESSESLSDVETTLSGLGILLRTSKGEFRNFGEVLDEVAGNWSQYGTVQQRAIAVAFSGTRQQEKFLTLMEHYGEATDYATVATNSAGTAIDKYENSYLKSAAAAQANFTAQFEQLSMAFLKSDFLIGTVNTGTGVLGALTQLTNLVGSLPVLAGAASGAISAMLNKGFVSTYTKKNADGSSGLGLTNIFTSSRSTAAALEAEIANDVKMMSIYESKVKQCGTSTRLFNNTMGKCSDAARAQAGALKDGTMTAQVWGEQQRRNNQAILQTSIATKAAAVGMKVLSVASNMLITMGVAWAIQTIVSSLDAMVNAATHASAKADEFAQKQREIADAAGEESQKLQELITQYEKLRGNDGIKIIDKESLSRLEDTNEELSQLKSTMVDEFGDGNVNLSIRPQVDMEDGSFATVYSKFETFTQNGKTIAIHFTPILEDGSMLSDNELNQYIQKCVDSGDVLKYDNKANGGKGIVLKIQPKLETQTTDDFIAVEDDWDVRLHEAQEKYYNFLNALGDETLYNNLIDADTRGEIRNIQEEITKLVGNQAENIDLVNGNLDEELKKLKEIDLRTAQEEQNAYVSSYHAAKVSEDAAIGGDKFLLFDDWDYVGRQDIQANKILDGMQNSAGGDLVRQGINADTMIKTAGTAEERIKSLKSAIKALQQDSSYNWADSDLFSGLETALIEYEKYVDNAQTAANGLLAVTVTVAEKQQDVAGITVNSAESYQQYRQALIDATKSDRGMSEAIEDGKVSIEGITASVDDLMATDFPQWYNEVNNIGQGAGSTKLPAFESMGEALKAVQAARDAYKGISDDIESAPDGKIPLSSLNSLIGTYSDLETAVTDYLSGAMDEQAILDILAQKYSVAANAAGYSKSITDELSDSTSELSTRLSKLSDVQTQFNSLSTALGEFSDSGIVGATTFTQLQAKFGNLDGFNNFVDVLANSNSTMAESREATNRLAAEFISKNGVLNDLTESTAALTIAELESYGVTNAEEIVTGRLSAARLEATLSASGLANSTWEVAVALLQECGASESAIAALKGLRQEQYNAKLACTDFITASSDVITSLMSQATAAGVAAKSISALSQMLALKARHDSGYEIVDYEKQMAELAEKAKADLSDINVILPEVKISLPKSSGSKNDVEEYIVKIDALREATKRLNDVQKELETTEARLGMVEDSDYAKRIEYAKTLAVLKEKENQLLHEQADLRRDLIQDNVDKLRGYGFDVDYNAKSNDFFVKNLELINTLGTGDKKAVEELRKSIEDLIGTTEDMNDANIDSSLAWLKNAEEAKQYKKEIMAIRQEQADEWINISEHKISLWDNQGGQEDKIIGQYQQMMDNAHKLADEYRAAGYSEESQEIRALQALWWDYHGKISDVQKKLDDERLKGLNEQKEAQQELLDLTIEMIKQETEDQIDGLEKSRDLYKEIIDLKIKSLELTEKERSYQDKVDTQTKDIGKLQSQADALALDDSREAQLKRAELLEEISDKQKDLSDTQHDYAIDNEKDALNEEYDMYSKTIDDKINCLKEFLNDNERLTQEAYRRINTQGESLYDDLLRYAKKYTKTSGDELSTMWDNAMLAAKKYGDYLAGMKATQDAIDHLEGTDTDLVDDMKENSSAWKPGRDDLVNNNENMGSSIGATKDHFGYWWKDGELLYGADYYSQDAIKALMKQYSSAWKSTTDESLQDTYANRALYLGNGIGATRDHNGRWWKDGKPLYHNGGVIGDQPTASQKEILMYGEKGEMVFPEKMQENLFKTISLSDFIVKKLGGTLLNGNAGTDALKNLLAGIKIPEELRKTFGLVSVPTKPAVVAPNMEINFEVRGDMSRETADYTAKLIEEKFYKWTTAITNKV